VGGGKNGTAAHSHGYSHRVSVGFCHGRGDRGDRSDSTRFFDLLVGRVEASLIVRDEIFSNPVRISSGHGSVSDPVTVLSISLHGWGKSGLDWEVNNGSGRCNGGEVHLIDARARWLQLHV
jgi:hypothetical protein